jgi:hypothetical protein
MSGFGIGIPMYFLTLRVMAMFMVLSFLLLTPNMYFYANQQADLSSSDLYAALAENNVSLANKAEESFQAASQLLLATTATCETDIVTLNCSVGDGTYQMENRLYKQSHLTETLGGWDLLCTGMLLLLFILYFRYEGAVAHSLNRTNTGTSTPGFSVVVKDPPPHENNPDAWQEYFSERWGPVAFVTVVLKNGPLLKKLAEEWELTRKIQMLSGLPATGPSSLLSRSSNKKASASQVEMTTVGDTAFSATAVENGSGAGDSGAGSDADAANADAAAADAKQHKQQRRLLLLLPFIFLCECINVCLCGESSGASEVASGQLSIHDESDKLPSPFWRCLQWFNVPGTRNLAFWRRRHESVTREIEDIFEEETTRDVDRVYVTFETEASQRRCLSELSDGLLCTYLDLPCRTKRAALFTDKHKNKHALQVETPIEPVAIIWENLDNDVFAWLWRKLGHLFAKIATLIVAVVFASLIYLLTTYGDTILGAVFVSLLNAATPFFVMQLNKHETHVSTNEIETSLFWKMLIIRISNSAIITYLRAAYFTSDNNTNSDATLLGVHEILLTDALLTPFLRALNLPYRMKQWFLAPRAKNQLALLNYYSGTQWHLGERYTNMITTLFTSLFYMALMPSGLLIAALSFTTQYWADKYLLLRQWRCNFYKYDSSVSEESQLPIFLCLLAHFLITSHFFASWPFDSVCLDASGTDDDAVVDSFSCCSKRPSSLYDILPGVTSALPAHLDGDEYSVQRYLTVVYSVTALGFGALLVVAYGAEKTYKHLRYLLTGYYKNVDNAEGRPATCFSLGDSFISVLQTGEHAASAGAGAGGGSSSVTSPLHGGDLSQLDDIDVTIVEEVTVEHMDEADTSEDSESAGVENGSFQENPLTSGAAALPLQTEGVHVDQRVSKSLGVFKNHNLKDEIGHKQRAHVHSGKPHYNAHDEHYSNPVASGKGGSHKRLNDRTAIKKHRGALTHNVLGLQAYIPTIKVNGLPFPLLACDVSGVMDHSFTQMQEVSGDYKLRSKLQLHHHLARANGISQRLEGLGMSNSKIKALVEKARISLRHSKASMASGAGDGAGGGAGDGLTAAGLATHTKLQNPGAPKTRDVSYSVDSSSSFALAAKVVMMREGTKKTSWQYDMLSRCKQYDIDAEHLKALPEMEAELQFRRETGEAGKGLRNTASTYTGLKLSRPSSVAAGAIEAASAARKSEFKPSSERHCTDVGALLLLIVHWLVLLVVVGIGVGYGSPEKLLYASDHTGQTCGTGDREDRPLVYYPQLQEDLMRAFLTNPTKYDLGTSSLSDFDLGGIAFYGICVTKCPTAGDFVDAATGIVCESNAALGGAGDCKGERTDFNTKNVLYRCLQFNQIDSTSTVQCLDPVVTEVVACNGVDSATTDQCRNTLASSAALGVLNGTVTSGAYKGFPVVNGFTVNSTSGEGLGKDESTFNGEYCTKAVVRETTATELPAKSDPLVDKMSSYAATMQRWWGDLLQSSGTVILCGGLFAVLLCVIWIIALERFAGAMVWCTIGLFFSTLVVLTLYLYYQAGIISLEIIGLHAARLADRSDSFLEGTVVSGSASTVASAVMGTSSSSSTTTRLLTSTASAVASAAASAAASATVTTRLLTTDTTTTTTADTVYELGDTLSTYTTMTKWFESFAYIMTAVTAIVFLMILAKRRTIKIAIGIIREASKATMSMPMILFSPIIPNVVTILCLLGAMYVSACLASIDQTQASILDQLVTDSQISNETIAALSSAYGVGSASYSALLNRYFTVHAPTAAQTLASALASQFTYSQTQP